MRTSFRLRKEEEEEESVFISMTDMTVGFLFIVIILLAFFATQIAPGETVPKVLLDERDEQVALLQERLLIYRDLVADADEDVIVALQNSIHDLTDQNRVLAEQLEHQQSTLAALRTELDAGSSDDLHLKIRQLRSEIDRLHQLLRRSETENPIARYNTLAAEELAELLTRIQSRVRAIDDQIEVATGQNTVPTYFGPVPATEIVHQALKRRLELYLNRKSRVEASDNAVTAFLPVTNDNFWELKFKDQLRLRPQGFDHDPTLRSGAWPLAK